MQDMEKKVLKHEKRLKKKTEDRMRELKFVQDKNYTKRQKALENFNRKNKDKDHEGYLAFNKCFEEIEKRVKDNHDEELNTESQKYKNFKVYMTQQ